MDQQPINCFIGLFDILGFKAVRQREGTASLYKKFSRAVLPIVEYAAAGAMEEVTRNGQSVLVAKPSNLSCSYIAFSDTIIFASKDDSLGSFLRAVFASRELVKLGFGMKQPVRGAIGYGDAIMGPNVFVGSAIEDAYIHEKIQVWSGCMLTKSCLDFISPRNYLRDYIQIFEYASSKAEEGRREMLQSRIHDLIVYHVPICRNPRSGPAEYSNLETVVIDWTCEVSKEVAKGAFLPSEEPHVKQIVANTLEFERRARERHPT